MKRTMKRTGSGFGYAVLRTGAILAGVLTGLSQPTERAEAAWQPGHITVGDGHGGTIAYPAYKQGVSVPGSSRTLPFGLVQMDDANHTVAMAVGSLATDGKWHPYITFSSNGGNSWSGFQNLPTSPNVYDTSTWPSALTYLGGGNLSYLSGGRRYVSTDYGETGTWSSSGTVQPVKGVYTDVGFEGNVGVDRDANGNTTRLMEVDYYWPNGPMVGWPQAATNAVFRYSLDQGLTWQGEVQPPSWKWDVTYKGTVYHRGVSEGSVVRAANNTLVAALRTDMPPQLLPTDCDNVEGTGVSISTDNGATWSAVNVLYEAGRHHASLQRLPNGDLVMTLIRRVDISAGASEPDSYMRGLDALVSHDNGLTWNLDRQITLDEFDYYDPSRWPAPYGWCWAACGHLGSTVLADGSMLAAYGNDKDGVAKLIKWDPTAVHAPEPSCWAILITVLLGAWAYAWKRRRDL
jgi:hypothetical protein